MLPSHDCTLVFRGRAAKPGAITAWTVKLWSARTRNDPTRTGPFVVPLPSRDASPVSAHADRPRSTHR
jgi:hypothetical protein